MGAERYDIYGTTDDVYLQYLWAEAAYRAAVVTGDPDLNGYVARAAYWMVRAFPSVCAECETRQDDDQMSGNTNRCKSCMKKRRQGLDYPRQEQGSKICPCCNQVLGVQLFASNRRNKDGLQNYCRVCMSEKVKASRLRRQGKKPRLELKAHPSTVKVMEKQCRKCRETKPAADFPANARISDGLHSYCRVCARKAVNASRRRRVSG